MTAAPSTAPNEICARFDGTEQLRDEDRGVIVDIARGVLLPFQPALEADTENHPEPPSTDAAAAPSTNPPDAPSDTPSKAKV
jgi:hypothetical protein